MHLEDQLKLFIDLPVRSQRFVPVSFLHGFRTHGWPLLSYRTHPFAIDVKKRFASFCKEFRRNPRNASSPSIPRILHFIWLGSPPPSKMQAAVSSWRKYHPDWDIRVWTDEEMKGFRWSSPRFEALFKFAPTWIEEADILRIELLYQFGGIYADLDMACVKSFEDLVSRDVDFFAGLESNHLRFLGKPAINNAIIGSAKGHPVLERWRGRVKGFSEEPALFLPRRIGTGPLTETCAEMLASPDSHRLLILPPSYFYPAYEHYNRNRAMSHEDLASYRLPETFAVHLWEGSWIHIAK